MKALVIALSCTLSSAHGGGIYGGFTYSLSPKIAAPGQTVKFECRKLSPSIYGYQTTWTIAPTPISSKKTYLLRLVSKKNSMGLPMAGYDGPVVEFNLVEPAVYQLMFDSTSEFQEDLGDTAVFEVTPPIRVAERVVPTKQEPKWTLWNKFSGRNIDGRLRKNKPNNEQQNKK